MKAILTYHSIDDSGSPISITAAAFRRHVESLASHGPRVYSVEELLRLPSAVDGAAITFDDGYTNFATVAWPLLRDHAMPVTVYVPTDHAGLNNSWDAENRSIPRLELMPWPVLQRIAGEGVTLDSHTCSHPHLDELTDLAVADEMTRSADVLEREIGRRPTGIAYPYGAVNERVARCAADVYAYACTTELRALSGNEAAHMVPRLDTYYFRDANALRKWGSPRMRLYLRGRAGARRCRQLLTSRSRS